MSYQFTAEDKEFMVALLGTDELSIVIRTHIFVESKLLEFLELVVLDSKHLERMNLGYEQRVHLAVALGLKARYAKPLLSFGKLRNIFAHRLDSKITKDRIDALYKSFASEDKNLAQAAYKSANKQVPKTKGDSLQSAPISFQFILIAVIIRSMLIKAVKEVIDGKE